MIEVRAATFIAFYTTAQAAERAEPRAVRAFHRLGGSVRRRGSAIVGWIKPPAPAIAEATYDCVFA